MKYLAVTTSGGVPPEIVLLPPEVVQSGWNTAAIPVALTRAEALKSAPDVLPDDRRLMSSRELEGCHVSAII